MLVYVPFFNFQNYHGIKWGFIKLSEGFKICHVRSFSIFFKFYTIVCYDSLTVCIIFEKIHNKFQNYGN